MRKFSLAMLVGFIALVSFGNPIDVKQAKIIAEQFLAQQTGAKNTPELTLCYTGGEHQKSGDASFYIFTSTEQGFVITAADDAISPILGYSTESIFETENMPENLRYWLSFYEANIPDLVAKGDARVSPKGGQRVNPLLGDIAWNQGYPYNLLCPSSGGERTVTGCVATAMAQIMRYHQWPERATGSITYTTQTLSIEISEDFDDKDFDWTNMASYYSDNRTQAQEDAVAQLMYYAGVSVEMNYNTSSAGGSGAYSSDVPHALVNNFNYSVGIDFLYRNAFSYDEWAQIIRSELDAKRPIYYSGGSPQGGHAFVCDGYDENGLFHINWGWGGSSNGFFSLMEMAPSSQGIGAGGGGGYINYQYITIGIKKPESGDVPPPTRDLMFDFFKVDNLIIERSDPANFTIVEIRNQGIKGLNSSLALALYSEDEELISIMRGFSDLDLKPGYGWSLFQYFSNIDFSSVEEGKYRIYVILKRDNPDSQWEKVPSSVLSKNFIPLEVTSTHLYFGEPDYPALTLKGIELPNAFYTDKSSVIHLTIENPSAVEFNSMLHIRTPASGDDGVVNPTRIIIPAGATRTIVLALDPISSSSTTTTLRFYYDQLNGTDADESDVPTGLLGEEPIQVLESSGVQGSLPNFTNIALDKNSFEVGAPFTYSFDAISTDAVNHFSRPILAFIFLQGQTSSAGYIGYSPNFSLAPNETKHIDFTQSLYMDPGNYFFAIFYHDGNTWRQANGVTASFELKPYSSPVTVEVKGAKGVDVYPNPTSEQIIVVGLHGENNQLKLYNTQGQLLLSNPVQNNSSVSLSHLPNGVYICIINSADGTIIKRKRIVKQ